MSLGGTKKYKVGDGIRFLIGELEEAEGQGESPDDYLKRRGREFYYLQSKTIIDEMEKLDDRKN